MSLATDIKHAWNEETRFHREQADNLEMAVNVNEILNIFVSPRDKWPKWLLTKFNRWSSSITYDTTPSQLINLAVNGTKCEKLLLARLFCKDPKKQGKCEIKQRNYANKLLEPLGYRLEALPKVGPGSCFVERGNLRKHLNKAQAGEKNSLDSKVIRLDNASWWPDVFLEAKVSRGTGGSQDGLMIVIESLLKEAQGFKDVYVGALADVEQAYSGRHTFEYLNKNCDDNTFITDTRHLYEVLKKIENKHKPCIA